MKINISEDLQHILIAVMVVITGIVTTCCSSCGRNEDINRNVFSMAYQMDGEHSEKGSVEHKNIRFAGITWDLMTVRFMGERISSVEFTSTLPHEEALDIYKALIKSVRKKYGNGSLLEYRWSDRKTDIIIKGVNISSKETVITLIYKDSSDSIDINRTEL